jgi:putative transposase
MGRRKKERKPLPPIWRAPDDLWAEVEPILAELDPPKQYGPERTEPRPIFDAVIYRLRTGCQWNWLPKDYPDDSTVHRHYQRWVQAGVFKRLWAVLIEHCEDLGGVDWESQAADTTLGKARKGGTRSGRTRPTVRSAA